MIIQKSYMPIHEWRDSLGRKFREAGLSGRNDNIGGFNTFIGIAETELHKAMDVDSEWPFSLKGNKEWDAFWKKAGVPAPGKLPAGMVAVVSLGRMPSENNHARVEVAELVRHTGWLGSTMGVNFRSGSEPNTSGGPGRETFTVAIVPKTLGGWTFSLESGTRFETSPTLVTDALQGAPVVEEHPKVQRGVAASFKRAAGLDTSPEALAVQLRKEHSKSLFKPGPSRKVFDLIDAGADLEWKDDYGRTILMQAAGYGHLELVKVLLAKGANTDVKTKEGWDAEFMAQEVADNVKDRPDPSSQKAFRDYTAIVNAIREARANRAPKAAAAPSP